MRVAGRQSTTATYEEPPKADADARDLAAKLCAKKECFMGTKGPVGLEEPPSRH